ARQIAARLVRGLDGDAARALTIARTETHRAYREAHFARYRSMPDVYAGWRWHANLDGRTCPVCVAKHGVVHALEDGFAGHPNCRCRPVPVVNSLADILGFDDAEVASLQANINDAMDIETGEEWFAAQSADVQRGILGASKHDAYT